MQQEGTLLTLAEIAIAFAGFSGVVSVLGRRASGSWLPEDRLRLSWLLENSFLAFFGSLLPIGLYSFDRSQGVAWAWASGFLAVSLVAVNAIALVRVHRQGLVVSMAGSWPRALARMWSPALIVSLLAYNAFSYQGFGPYFVALVSFFAAGAIHFASLLSAELGAAFYEGESVKPSSSSEAGGE